MADEERKKVDVSVDKVTIKNLAMGGLLGGGGECFVDVKDGKAVRIRPFKYDWKYDYEQAEPLEDRAERRDPGAAAQGPARALLARLQEEDVLPEPHQVPHEAGRLGPRTGRGTPRTAARASTRGSPGTKPPTSSPPRSGASTRSTARSPSWRRATATARTRPSTRPTATRPACST